MRLIIIGNNSSKLSEFLQRQGTFSVQFKFDSTVVGLPQLQSNIVNADKFIVIVSERTNLAEEIRALLTLFGGEGASLCRVKEIVFVIRKDLADPHNKELISALSTSFEAWQKTLINWTAPFVDIIPIAELSYDAIYRAIIGNSSVYVVNSKRTAKYRVERGKDTRQAFIGKYEKMFVEPESNGGLDDYEELAGIMASTESNSPRVLDTAKYPEYEDMDVPKFVLPSSWKSECYLISGEHLSGSTIRTAVLARSACLAGKSVFILDLSINSGIIEALHNLAVMPLLVSNNEFLLGTKFEEETCSVLVINSQEYVLDVLAYLYANRSSLEPDVILINAEISVIRKALDIFAKTDCALILCSQVYKESVESLVKYVVPAQRAIVWLSDFLNLASWSYIHTSETAKKLLGIPVAEPIDFETFDISDNLYKSVSVFFMRNEV